MLVDNQGSHDNNTRSIRHCKAVEISGEPWNFYNTGTYLYCRLPWPLISRNVVRDRKNEASSSATTVRIHRGLWDHAIAGPKAANDPDHVRRRVAKRMLEAGSLPLVMSLFLIHGSRNFHGIRDLPASLLEARAADSPNWDETPLMRCVEFKFFTTRIWKQVALPWREAMTDQARKSSQIYDIY